MLWENDKEDTSPSFKSVHFPKLQIFDEILCMNLQSPVIWGRHIGVPPAVGHQHGGRKILLTSGTYSGYLGH